MSNKKEPRVWVLSNDKYGIWARQPCPQLSLVERAEVIEKFAYDELKIQLEKDENKYLEYAISLNQLIKENDSLKEKIKLLECENETNN